jgi:hypothetical protein
MTEQQKMASITRLSGSLIRISGTNFGMLKYVRLVPTNSIMYINILDRCLDIHYKDKKSFDTLIFPTDTARDVAIAAVEESFAGSKQHPVVKDYPF